MKSDLSRMRDGKERIEKRVTNGSFGRFRVGFFSPKSGCNEILSRGYLRSLEGISLVLQTEAIEIEPSEFRETLFRDAKAKHSDPSQLKSSRHLIRCFCFKMVCLHS